MRTSLTGSSLLLGLTLLTSPALAAPTVVINRPVAAFKAIEIGGGAELTIRKGSQPTLVLSGEDEVLQRYRTEVRDGVLHIDPNQRLGGRHEPVRIVATTASLQSLEASGGVDVTVEPGVAARAFTLSLSGGVHPQAPALALDTLRITASGGVDALLGGSATSAVYDLSGGVELDTRPLQLEQLDLEASGGCTVKVKATRSIVARASGGVDVTVLGQPAQRKVKTSGGADVTFVN